MSIQNNGKSYQEISFNKQITEEEVIEHSNYDSFNTQNASKETTFEQLTFRIKQLQMQLTKQKEKCSQLQKRNQQLTDMLVSASQSSVKRNQNFIKEVQRKICNFKVVKDLSSSSFRGIRQTEEKEPVMRMMTETGYQSSKKLSITNRENNSSRTKFDSNKENSNHINGLMKTEAQKCSKSKYTNQDHALIQLRPKERSTLKNFESQKSISGKNSENHNFGSTNIDLTNKNSILSPFSKNVDLKTFDKLEHKLMRM